MATAPKHNATNEGKAGLFSGMAAYLMWGLFPIYFVAMKHVPALELLAYRIVWSIPFGLLILLFRKQITETLRAFVNPKTVILLAIAAIALAANWGVYIYAIQQDQIFQGSLGYYINPLLYVLVGVVFFKEKLSALQGLAIVIVLALPAMAVLWFISSQGEISWNAHNTKTDILIVLAGPLTVLPLLAFAFAARRIRLSTLGILQYIGPTMQFACGIYYGEAFTAAHAWCFGLIWLGVGVFAFDAIRSSRAVAQTEILRTSHRPDSQ